MLGSGIETHEIVRTLKGLGFELVPEPGASPEFSVRIPSWRLDVEREIDLIEEIARLRGYNSFPNTLPAFSGAVIESPTAQKQAKLRSTLLALGYNEAVSLTFISHADAETFSSTPVVELANPLSEEASLMRSSLIPGMLEMLAYNLNRGTEDVRLFEIGDVFEAAGSGTAERSRVCLSATASSLKRQLPQGDILDRSKGKDGVDVFRSFKGHVETLLAAFEHDSLSFDAQTLDYYDPAWSARAILNGELVAYFGALHPQVAGERKLRQQIYLAEIFADRLYGHALRAVRYQPLPRFPAVERDFSFLFPDNVSFASVNAAVHSLALSQLRSFDPVELFRGGSVPKGHYSILLRAKFQSLDRTLREDEVADWSAQMVQALQSLGGTQRM
jgi:phenylalanyl-tRNA synthetase beta chain